MKLLSEADTDLELLAKSVRSMAGIKDKRLYNINKNFDILSYIFSIFCWRIIHNGIADEDNNKNSHDIMSQIMCSQKLDSEIYDAGCSKMKISNDVMQITYNSDDVGLVLSSTCKRLVSVNSTACPSYKTLDMIYPDVIIDPDSTIIDRIKIITISHTLPSYKTSDSLKMSYNGSTHSFDYSFGEKRFVDKKCRNVIVNSELFVIGDTIRFLQNDCDGMYTYLNNNVNFTKQASPINHTDFGQYHYNLWLNDVIRNCVSEYGKCN